MLRRAASAVGLTVSVAGLPFVLVAAAGPPSLEGLPTWAWLRTGMHNQYLPLDPLLRLLALLAWLLWLYLALTVALRTLAVVAARLHLAGSGALLAATEWLTLPRLPRTLLGVATQPGVIGRTTDDVGPDQATQHADAPTPDPPAALTRDATPAPPTYVVAPGDSLWQIAERQLGDPLRWQELWQLNRDRRMPDGRTLHRPGLILPGWVLRLPADAVPPATVPPAAAPGPPPTHNPQSGAHGPTRARPPQPRRANTRQLHLRARNATTSTQPDRQQTTTDNAPAAMSSSCHPERSSACRWRWRSAPRSPQLASTDADAGGRPIPRPASATPTRWSPTPSVAWNTLPTPPPQQGSWPTRTRTTRRLRPGPRKCRQPRRTRPGRTPPVSSQSAIETARRSPSTSPPRAGSPSPVRARQQPSAPWWCRRLPAARSTPSRSS